MKSLADCDIRYTRITDVSYLKQWLSSPEVGHFFPMGTQEEIELAVRAWINFCRYHASLTAIKDGTPLGIGTLFLFPYKKVSHQCLCKMIVDPQFHRQGVGTVLLRNLKHLAKNYFHLEIMKMEVFEGNPMIELLKKEGFHEAVRQERFVKENGQYRARLLYEAVL